MTSAASKDAGFTRRFRTVLGACAVIVLLGVMTTLVYQVHETTQLLSNIVTGSNVVEVDNEMPALSVFRERRQAAPEGSATEDPDSVTDEDDIEVDHPRIEDKTGNKAVVKNKTEHKILRFHLQTFHPNNAKLIDCNQPLRKTFPDLDYALLGYDILKGYPLAMGHDPGFTHRIFRADYSGHQQTADCHFSVPAGLTILPDVSCTTSFASDEIKTVKDLSNALAVNAHVEGGGWGVSYSASSEYKKMESVITSRYSMYIISKASCEYYYVSLKTHHPPPFDEEFIEEAKLLASSIDNDHSLLRFIDYYGTHYTTEMTFGARFMYIHKMSLSSYRSFVSDQFTISIRANYHGLMNVGGGLHLSADQKQAALQFAKKVETTTMTVGAAPPANGDAMTWASTVKESPVPAKYNLASIDNLFSEEYMGHLGFDYGIAKKRIQDFVQGGGLSFRRMVKEGEVILENIFINSHDSESMHASQGVCIKSCISEKLCKAVSFCDKQEAGCLPAASTGNCIMHKTSHFQYATHSVVKGWKLMTTSMRNTQSRRTRLVLERAWLQNWKQLQEASASGQVNTYGSCMQICERDSQCRIVIFCDRTRSFCSRLNTNCKVFGIDMLYKDNMRLISVPSAKTVIFGRAAMP